MNTARFPILKSLLVVGTLVVLTGRPAFGGLVAVSNLSENSISVGHLKNPSRLVSSSFTTDVDPHNLTSVSSPFSNYDDVGHTFEASIYGDALGQPSLLLHTLSGLPSLPPASGPGSPATGILTFTSSGFPFAPNTTYWLAVRSLENFDADYPYVGMTDSFGQTSPVGWTIGDVAKLSDDAAATWSDIGSPYLMKFDVTVASVPTALSDAHLWIGLKNSNDQGTQFDLRVEVFQNANPVPVASGLTRCMTGVTRNPSLAKLVTVPFVPFGTVSLASGDTLSLRVSTRIGTTATDAKCAGPRGSHNNANGLRLYYDSTSRASRFDATISPNPSEDLYLHSDGGACPGGGGASPNVFNRFLDSTPPPATNPTRCKDSTNINFAGGNPYSVIGTWSLTLP